MLDAERRRGRAFEDAALFALLMLAIVRSRVREAAPDGEPSPGVLATIIEETVAPISIRMTLPHALSHRIRQALTLVGRLSHRPDARVATKRLVFREGFSVALDLFELSAMATGRGEDLVGSGRPSRTGPAGPRPPPEAPRRPTRPAASRDPHASAGGAGGGVAGRSSSPVNFCPAAASRGMRQC